MSEEQVQKDMLVVSQILDNHEQAALVMTISDMWMALSAIQLAVRHPDLHEATVKRLTEIGHYLQAIVIERHPEGLDLATRGWDPAFDEAADDDQDLEDGVFFIPIYGGLVHSMFEDDYDDLDEFGNDEWDDVPETTYSRDDEENAFGEGWPRSDEER